jgi:hypothetical protein
MSIDPDRETTMTNILRSAAAALLIAFAWACESHQIASPETASLNIFASSEDVNVQAATLQWLIDNKSATGLDAQCVSVGYPDEDLDPGHDLLDRFFSYVPAVVPYSSCTIGVSGDLYRPTGGAAEWFFLGTPTVTRRSAEIAAGFHLNGRLSERFLCKLHQTGATWTVRSCTLTSAA